MIKIKEAVVVEGRDDEAAVLKACECMVICTHGYGITKETLDLIKKAYESCGIIIFTDPDHAGENIRKKLKEMFPKAKHAYLTKEDAEKKGDIGIENASTMAIESALCGCLFGSDFASEKKLAGAGAREKVSKTGGCATALPGNDGSYEITKQMLIELGLSGGSESSRLRSEIGRLLGTGSCNANAFLKRLQGFGITKEELIGAWEKVLSRE